jgi:hypothetical protein
MDEETVKDLFGSDYKEPSYDDGNDWNEWAGTIELKVSTQGKIIIGLGVGVTVALLLTSLQGKVVLNLVKVNKGVVETLNNLVTIANGNTTEPTRPSYTQPTNRVDTSTIDPPDEEAVKDFFSMGAHEHREPEVGEL